jgi:hypothetical protein
MQLQRQFHMDICWWFMKLKHGQIQTLKECPFPSVLGNIGGIVPVFMLALELSDLGVNTIATARRYVHSLPVHNEAMFKWWPNWLIVGNVDDFPISGNIAGIAPVFLALESSYIRVNAIAIARL